MLYLINSYRINGTVPSCMSYMESGGFGKPLPVIMPIRILFFISRISSFKEEKTMLPKSSAQIRTRIPTISGSGVPSDNLMRSYNKRAKSFRNQIVMDYKEHNGKHTGVTVKLIGWNADGKVVGHVRINNQTIEVVKVTTTANSATKGNGSIGVWMKAKAA